jgi:hypothetical protein
MERNNNCVESPLGLHMPSLFQMSPQKMRWQSTTSHTILLLHSWNFAWPIDPSRIHTQFNEMKVQALTALLALTLVLLLEMSKIPKHVAFLYMTGKLVLCIWCLPCRKEVGIFNTCALSFAAFWLGLVIQQLV